MRSLVRVLVATALLVAIARPASAQVDPAGTKGFTYTATGNGTPTGVPALSTADRVATYWDATNKVLYLYSGGAWRSVGAVAPLTLAAGTVTANTPILTMTETWNNGAVVFQGAKMNVVNSASAAGSVLQDYQVGGTSVTAIMPDGALRWNNAGTNIFLWPTAGSNRVTFATTDQGIAGAAVQAGAFTVIAGGASRAQLDTITNPPGLHMDTLGEVGWGNTVNNPSGSLVDTHLSRRGGAGVLGLSNTTNPVVFQLYETTDNDVDAPTNFSRLEFRKSGGDWLLQTTQGGTGNAAGFEIGSVGLGQLSFFTNNTTRWSIGASTGHLTTQSDNNEDIGTLGNFRPRTIYTGTSVFTPLIKCESGVNLLVGNNSGNASITFADNNNLTFFSSGLISFYGPIYALSGAVFKYYANTPTAGALGMAPILAYGRVAAKTTGQTLINAFATPPYDSSFEVSPNMRVTATAVGLQMIVAYTDEENAAQSLTLNFSNVGGTFVQTATTVGAYEGVVLRIRTKASSTITVTTTITSGTYNAECDFKWLEAG